MMVDELAPVGDVLSDEKGSYGWKLLLYNAGHWCCDLDRYAGPGTCNSIPFDPANMGNRVPDVGIGVERVAAIRADLRTAIGLLPEWRKKFVAAVIVLGAQYEGEETRAWEGRIERFWWDWAMRRRVTFDWSQAEKKRTFRAMARSLSGR